MRAKWALGIVVPIFKGKGDIGNSSCYGAVEFLEHGMKVVERVWGKRLHRIVNVVEIQFGFMSEGGTIDYVFILWWMQEEYHGRRKSCICVLWT